MQKRNFLRKIRIFVALVGLVFALSSTSFYGQRASAIEGGNNQGTTEVQTQEKSEEEKRKEEEQRQKEEAEKQQTEKVACQEQAGSVQWIVCPVISFIGKATDELYKLISNLLVLKPITSDEQSPVYIVWQYARGITNIVFVIFILVIIFSQLTGFGLNNYGIKKTLPRIIVAAILVNLSFVICSLAVDLSNIIGASLGGFFEGVQLEVMKNGGSISSDINWGDLIGALVTGVGVGTVTLGLTGGLGGLFFMLVPILLGAVLSVIVGLITITLRHALVVLLVMIAPLAFVAYLLPNTEKWFEKWKDLFVRMLVFFPMFSLLFGASKLAGWSIIASAKGDGFWVIVGLAVQILPLFLCWSLMKLSGTILGTVGDKIRKLGAPIENAVGGWAGSHNAARKAKYLGNQSNKYNVPRRLAQYMDKRKARRESDAGYWDEQRKLRGEAYASEYTYANTALNRKLGIAGKVTRRGEQKFMAQISKYQNMSRAEHNKATFGDSITHEARNKKQADRLKQADKDFGGAVDLYTYEQARSATIDWESLGARDARIKAAMRDEKSDMYKAYYSMTGGEKGGKEYLNTFFANAIEEKNKNSRIRTANYTNILKELDAKEIREKFDEALKTKNADLAVAATDTMMLFADTDVVMDKMAEASHIINDSSNIENVIMQKRLLTSFLDKKGTNAVLWGWTKCNNKARNVSRLKRAAIEKDFQTGVIKQDECERKIADLPPEFITFEQYLDTSDESLSKKFGVDVDTIMNELKEKDIVPQQDKTLWNYSQKHGQLFMNDKQRRDGLFSFAKEGEVLRALVDSHLGKNMKWEDKAKRNKLTFSSKEDLDEARSNIERIMRGCNATHLSKFKSDILNAFAAVMSEDFVMDASTGEWTCDFSTAEKKEKVLTDGLRYMKDHFIGDGDPTKYKQIQSDLRKRAQRGTLDMNDEVRRLLNKVLEFEK